MARDRIITEAIERAKAHAKDHGIAFGKVCATIDDKLTFKLLRIEGDRAIVDTVGGEEVRKLEDVFDANLVRRLALQIQAEEYAEFILDGDNAGIIVVNI